MSGESGFFTRYPVDGFEKCEKNYRKIDKQSSEMIHGIGIDVVEISRINEMETRWGARFTERIFTAEEISYCASRASRAASLAVRFAAKEAFAKALGSGWDHEFQWKDFSIGSQVSGKPLAVLSPSMQERLKNARIHLSLSHSEQFAAAVVIIEEPDPAPPSYSPFEAGRRRRDE
jgi:holo-[acyl-carrier protein] synthase